MLINLFLNSLIIIFQHFKKKLNFEQIKKSFH